MAKKKPGPGSYKELHVSLPNMTEQDLRDAMQAELNKGEKARPDLLARLIGRFNRMRGSRVARNVLGLLSYRGKKDVNAALDSDR
jgi:hypothetical protein